MIKITLLEEGTVSLRLVRMGKKTVSIMSDKTQFVVVGLRLQMAEA